DTGKGLLRFPKIRPKPPRLLHLQRRDVRSRGKGLQTLPREPAVALSSRRHSFERQFLHTRRGLRDVQISFRIAGNLMPGSNDASRLDVTYNLERLAIHNENAVPSADIKELLVRIGRQSEIARERYIGS